METTTVISRKQRRKRPKPSATQFIIAMTLPAKYKAAAAILLWLAGRSDVVAGDVRGAVLQEAACRRPSSATTDRKLGSSRSKKGSMMNMKKSKKGSMMNMKKDKPAVCGEWSPQPYGIVPPSGDTYQMKSAADIPTCGTAHNWDCVEHPLLDPADYCRSLQKQSADACPVEFKPLDSLYALMHYWYPGNNSYPDRSAINKRDSWGFQYYSLEHDTFRYDQIFAMDYDYDANERWKKPGAQLFETARTTSNLFIDINIPNDPNIGILDKDPRGAGGACIYIPAPTWQLMKSADLSNPDISTYCGISKFPSGYFQVGTEFDVYRLDDRWFNGTPIFWYVDRETKEIAAQLYYQSHPGDRTQNYFWDFSRRIHNRDVAKQMFRQNPHYYFDINRDMVERACSNDIYDAVIADEFPEYPCVGPPDDCVPI